MVSVAQAQCVLAVAQHGSFRKAAAALFMAQPAVSASVYKVESALRVELFERTKSGAVLTSHGATLLPHFEALLASHESVMTKSAQINAGEDPVLRVASHRMGQMLVLSPALTALRQVVGAVVVDVVHADEPRTVELVKSGQVELGIGVRVPGASLSDALIEEGVIGETPIVIYCRPDHRFASLEAIEIPELFDETIVSTRSAAGDRLFRRHFGSNADVSRVVVDDAQVALQMVTDGVGVSPLLAGLESMVPVPIVAVPLRGDLGLISTVIRRTGAALSPTAEALWQLLLLPASGSGDKGGCDG